jgi:hypothetical protein
MLYFETRVRTSLLGMRILEFSGMVGYSGFRVRPDLMKRPGWSYRVKGTVEKLSEGHNFARTASRIAQGKKTNPLIARKRKGHRRQRYHGDIINEVSSTN